MRRVAACTLLLTLCWQLLLPIAALAAPATSRQLEIAAAHDLPESQWVRRAVEGRDLVATPGRDEQRGTLRSVRLLRPGGAVRAGAAPCRRVGHRAVYPLRRLVQRRGPAASDDPLPA